MFGNRESTKERLLRSVSAYSFMAYEAMLYLDAYPNCAEALECYNKYKHLENRARKEYEARYGWLSIPDECSSWEWTKGPWPWQIDKEEK